jgi:hypothetical protein
VSSVGRNIDRIREVNLLTSSQYELLTAMDDVSHPKAAMEPKYFYGSEVPKEWTRTPSAEFDKECCQADRDVTQSKFHYPVLFVHRVAGVLHAPHHSPHPRTGIFFGAGLPRRWTPCQPQFRLGRPSTAPQPISSRHITRNGCVAHLQPMGANRERSHGLV